MDLNLLEVAFALTVSAIVGLLAYYGSIRTW